MLKYSDLTEEQKNRCLNKIIKSDDNNECWGFDSFDRALYKGISLYHYPRLAHRIIWMIFNKKDIPEGMCVLHSCDNTKCVNPNHLFLGTHQDNMIDRSNKKRCNPNFGEKHPLSKLTEQEVISILEKYNIMKQNKIKKIAEKLAQEYNVHKSTIYSIFSKKTWKHLSCIKGD